MQTDDHYYPFSICHIIWFPSSLFPPQGRGRGLDKKLGLD